MGIWQTALAAIKSDAKPSAPSTDEESGNTDGSAPYMEAVMKRNQSKRDSTDPKMRIKEVLGLSLPGTPMISRGPSSNAGSKASQDAPVNPPSAGDVVGTESLLKQASSLAIQAGAEQDTTNERLPTILSFGVAAGGTESEGCRRTRGWVAHPGARIAHLASPNPAHGPAGTAALLPAAAALAPADSGRARLSRWH